MRDYTPLQRAIQLQRQATSGFEEARVSDWPLHLDVDIDNRCNFHCGICYRTTFLNQHGSTMPAWLFRKIVREGGQWNLKSLNLDHGGEPTLHPQLTMFIEAARDASIDNISFHTNGLRLDRELGSKVITAGLSRIAFSLDATTADTFRLQRGGDPRQFTTIQRNVLDFLETRTRLGATVFVRVSFIRTSVNAHEAELFREYWAPLVDEVHFRDFSDPGGEIGAPFGNPRAATPIDPRKAYCTQLNWRLSLRWDGIALPCCHPNGFLMPVGDVKVDSVHDIWTGMELRRIVDSHANGHANINAGCQHCLNSPPHYVRVRPGGTP